MFEAEVAVNNYIGENFNSMQITTKKLTGLPGLTRVTDNKTKEVTHVCFDCLNNKILTY